MLIVASALAMHYMQPYGVVLDPSMLRNVLRTDFAEARELLAPVLAADLLLYAVLPLLLLWRVRWSTVRCRARCWCGWGRRCWRCWRAWPRCWRCSSRLRR